MALRPGLLLAMPVSSDPNLSRAVVLLVRHGEGASFGFVIDRPSTFEIAALFAALDMTWRGGAGVVFAGGPVSPKQAWILHEPTSMVDTSGTRAITPRLSLSSTPDRLRVLGADPPARLRILLGSIDWAPDQLAAAMLPGGVYTDADPELVFDTPSDALWERVQSTGTPMVSGIGARLRRMFGLASAIPKATVRRR